VSLLGGAIGVAGRAIRSGGYRHVRHAVKYAIWPVLLAFGCAFGTGLSLLYAGTQGGAGRSIVALAT